MTAAAEWESVVSWIHGSRNFVEVARLKRLRVNSMQDKFLQNGETFAPSEVNRAKRIIDVLSFTLNLSIIVKPEKIVLIRKNYAASYNITIYEL